MKACKKCSVTKTIDLFYVDDNTCKECRKLAVRNNRAANMDYYRAYDRARTNDPERVAARAAYANTEAGKASREKARNKYVANNPEKIAESRVKSREKYFDRYKARNALWSHLITGRAARPSNCESCGKECTPHGHHEDYTKPLDVTWLCVTCHAARHVEINRQQAA